MDILTIVIIGLVIVVIIALLYYVLVGQYPKFLGYVTDENSLCIGTNVATQNCVECVGKVVPYLLDATGDNANDGSRPTVNFVLNNNYQTTLDRTIKRGNKFMAIAGKNGYAFSFNALDQTKLIKNSAAYTIFPDTKDPSKQIGCLGSNCGAGLSVFPAGTLDGRAWAIYQLSA